MQDTHNQNLQEYESLNKSDRHHLSFKKNLKQQKTIF